MVAGPLLRSNNGEEEDPEGKSLMWADFLVIAVYFIGVLAVGLYTSWKTKKGSVQSYFLASRSMHWIPVGASLFASNIGSSHFIGLAGSGAASGIGIGAFEINAIFVLMMLGWLFVPVYMSSGIYTMPEYIRERFGGQRIRIYLSLLALILYVFTKISADLYAGALFITTSMNLEGDGYLYLSILILLAIAALFTIAGGLTAVIWTDFVQTILMIIGAFIVMAMTFADPNVGGYNGIINNYFTAVASNLTANDSCGQPPGYAMHFFRSAVPGESDLPWPGMLFGITISGIWYWCTDQVIVQRALSSRSMVYAKSGCVLAATIKFLPLFLLVFPGMASRILFTDKVACVDPEECIKICGSATGCTDLSYILLVLRLPDGLRGMMLAVMLAALMSSLTSVFNSASTIFTIDIWTRIHRNASEMELLLVGRCFVLVLVAVSVIWIPVIRASPSSQLFVYIQSISSFLSPPVCAVYILAIFWKRTNEQGAFWGLISGLAIGIFRFGIEFAFTVPTCGQINYQGKEDPRPEWIRVLVDNVHYLHFGCILFAITLIVTIVVSLLTEPIPDKCLHRLTYWSRNSIEVRTSVREWCNEKEPEADTNKLQVDDSKSVSNNSSSHRADPKWKRILFTICGVNSDAPAEEENPDDQLTDEEKAKKAAEFLEEKKPWTNVVDGCAILVMVLAAFMWGYYA